MGGGTYELRKVRIFLYASLALSPEFVTNTLLGLSRPVGKGPGGFPRKSSTTPWGAALFPCGEEANKLCAFFWPFSTGNEGLRAIFPLLPMEILCNK